MRDPATILLVEDDESLLHGISDLLEIADTGYDVQVLRATDGEDGLRLLSQQAPDLIISDIMMPHMDGFEFLGHVRKNPDWVHIPLIFLTARGEKRDIHEGRITGAELYITKPFDNNELLDLVKSQLDRTFQLQLARRSKLDKLKQGILRLLNHEFRTPLTYVTAYYEMLADSLNGEDNKNLPEYLRGIQTGCVRLTRLVEDLVAVIEIRTGDAQAAYADRARLLHNPGELLREAGIARQQEAEAKGLTIHYAIDENLPAIFGDPQSLLEIFDRLIDNGIKFTYCKRLAGRLTLTAVAIDSEVHFSVTDDGIGFPEQVNHQIFEPFFQHNREKMEQQGSGSGLTIVKGLVELHHGRIHVTSEEEAGSQFTVILPVYTGLQEQSSPSLADFPARKQATILIVEDDRFLLDGLRELLEIATSEYAFKVLTAVNGRAGLAVLADHQPDLIISDIMMPYMDGYQFLEEVRKNSAWLQIPFIFLTAKGERQDIHRGRRSGAEQYITKPYDSDKLLDLVMTQLNRHFQVQGVVAQSFDALKRSILELLQPNMRMPLTSVNDYSHRLAASLENAETDEDLKESLHGLKDASSRLTTLVEDFITLAELKAGEAVTAYRMRAHAVDAGSILYQAGLRYQHEIESAQVALHFNLEPELPLVFGDENGLLNALERLIKITFALCQRYDGADIYLESANDANWVELSLCSSLAYFEDAEAEKIAALFQQSDQTILELPDYGPNLAIVKGIVDLHDGRIELENINGQWCKIRLSLPIYQQAQMSN